MTITYLPSCIHCPMLYSAEDAGKPADERGGTYTGWFLPPGAELPEPHTHEVETCAQGCGEDVDPADGMFCSDDCRRDYIRENGE